MPPPPEDDEFGLQLLLASGSSVASGDCGRSRLRASASFLRERRLRLGETVLVEVGVPPASREGDRNEVGVRQDAGNTPARSSAGSLTQWTLLVLAQVCGVPLNASSSGECSSEHCQLDATVLVPRAPGLVVAKEAARRRQQLLALQRAQLRLRGRIVTREATRVQAATSVVLRSLETNAPPAVQREATQTFRSACVALQQLVVQAGVVVALEDDRWYIEDVTRCTGFGSAEQSATPSFSSSPRKTRNRKARAKQYPKDPTASWNCSPASEDPEPPLSASLPPSNPLSFRVTSGTRFSVESGKGSYTMAQDIAASWHEENDLSADLSALSLTGATSQASNVRYATESIVAGLEHVLSALREVITWPTLYADQATELGITWPKVGVMQAMAEMVCVRRVQSEPVVCDRAYCCTGRLVWERHWQSRLCVVSAVPMCGREVFEEARQAAAQGEYAVLFFDDIDALCPKRNAKQRHESRVVGQLLTLLDGATTKGHGTHGNVAVIACTSRPNAIEPALRRAGRLDKEIEVRGRVEPSCLTTSLANYEVLDR
eukprot:scaffold111_cov404-Prasinococcus_capsulatus_cf.AAC.12